MKKECDLRVIISLDEEKVRYLLEDIDMLREKLATLEDKLVDMIKSVKIDVEQRND